MKIKILGAGCAKCEKLYTEAAKAISLSEVQADLEKVEKIDDILDHGVMMTPALVIDDEVVSAGRVVAAQKIAQWIAERSR